jgi:hypothetical protein
MFRVSIVVLGLWVVAGIGGAWAEPDQAIVPSEVIQRAIAAHGGKDALAKRATVSYRTETVMYVDGEERKVVTDGIYQAPAQMKSQARFQSGITLIQWDSDGRAWQKLGEKPVEELRGHALKYEQHILYITYLQLLNPLVSDGNGFHLAAVGQSELDGRTINGIRVTKESQEPVTLFFDAKTNLLVKLQRKTYDRQEGKEQILEEIFSDFKDIDGAKQPTRSSIFIDGKKASVKVRVESKPIEKQPDSIFTPKTK